MLAGMDHPQDHQVGAVVSVLENVVTAHHLQDKLAVFFAPGDGTAEPGMSRENLRSHDDRIGNHLGQFRRMLLEEGRKPMKVGEGVVRPLQRY